MLESLHSIAACAILWLAVLGAGSPLARRLQLAPGDRLAGNVWTAGLGLTAIGWTFALLGYCGLLHPTAVGILTLIAAFWGLGELFCVACQRRGTRQFGATQSGATQFGARRRRLFAAGLAAAQELGNGGTRWLPGLAVISSAAMFVGALGPVTSSEALSRSVEVAKELALTHSLALAPMTAASSGAAFAELWFHWAWVFDGPVAVGLVQWSLGLLAAGATALLARQILGHGAAGAAAALLLLSPGVQYQLGAPADDLAAAAFSALALAAWWLASKDGSAQRWFAVAGLMLGTALAIKPTSIGVGVAIGVATAWTVWRKTQTRPEAIRGLVTLSLMACFLTGGWYLRDVARAALTAASGSRGNPASGLGIVLLALAAATIALRPRRDMRLLALMVAAGGASGVLLVGQQRWWIPLLPLLSVMAAHAWHEIARFEAMQRRLAQATIAGLVLIGLGLPLKIAREKAAVVCGMVSRDDYLLERHPEFAAVVLANRLVPDEGQLLADGEFGVYFHCRTTNAANYWRKFRDQGVGATDVATQFRSHGITHILLAQPESEPPVFAIPPSDSAPPADGRSAVLPLADFRLTRQDASVWRYRLLQVR